MRQNPKALEAVWDWAYNNSIGYLGTNTPIDKCYRCGFKGEFKATAKGFVCPQCGNHDIQSIDVVKRVCGYLGNPGIRGWNHGRNLELMSRKKNVDSQLETNLANFEKAKLDNDSRTDILDQVDKTDNL